MKSHLLNPFDVPKTVRNYLYDQVMLAWETDQVSIIPSDFSKKTLDATLGLRVEKLKKVSDVEQRSSSSWGPDEFLVFHGEGQGYESLFKRLRDAFAHGDYGLEKRDWLTIWHRYKERNEKSETTRLYGRLRQKTLKQLVGYLDQSSRSERGTTDD